MPGCAVLLLSLVVLSMGSNARRIRKRGLNHKVRLQILRSECIYLLITEQSLFETVEALSGSTAFAPTGHICG